MSKFFKLMPSPLIFTEFTLGEYIVYVQCIQASVCPSLWTAQYM